MTRVLTYLRRPWSWYVLAPILLVVIGVIVPVIYLVLRAFEADADTLGDLVFRTRNLYLFANTFLLAMGVLALGSVIALPMAWLTTRTHTRFRRVFTLFGVLPLAIPGYIMAYVLLATTGSYGTLARLFGIEIPRISGYAGAVLALTLATFPYLFLNLRTALLGLDPALEETARSLGSGTRRVLLRVIGPQLRPAFSAGALLVGLHVLGDFGVVSLMRFETFSYALYLQYAASYDRVYAACLALMLLALTGMVLFLEARLLRGLLLHRTGAGAPRRIRRTSLGAWKGPAYLFLLGTAILSVGIPATTVAYWMFRTEPGSLADLAQALWASLSASAPAAFLATALALPIAYLGVRSPSRPVRALERVAWFGYATPPLAFALALIFFSLRSIPWAYQTLGLLIVAYGLHFMAEAVGPIRSALYQAPPSMEEAARTLGRSPLRAFLEATFPLLRRGLLVGIAFVFLSAMKELPITFLLSPIGFQTLAVNVWGHTNEALFGAAAPYALTIMLISSLFVGLLLMQSGRPMRS